METKKATPTHSAIVVAVAWLAAMITSMLPAAVVGDWTTFSIVLILDFPVMLGLANSLNLRHFQHLLPSSHDALSVSGALLRFS